MAEDSDCSGASFVGPFSATDPFSDDVPFTLSSGDGTKTMCVEYKDVAGNTSTTYTDSIVLDQTDYRPSMSATSPTATTAGTSPTRSA